MYNGLIYFQKVSGYSGDTVSPEGKLSVENIDSNFFNLKSQDIRDITVSGNTLIFERWDCEQDITISLPLENYYTKEECVEVVNAVKDALEDKIEAISGTVEEKIEALEELVESGQEVTKEYVDACINAQSAITKQEIAILKEAYDDFVDCVNDKIDDIEDDIDAFKTEYTAKFATLLTTVDTKLTAHTTELDGKLSQFQSDFNTKIANLTTTINSFYSTLSAVDAEISGVTVLHEAQIVAANARIDELSAGTISSISAEESRANAYALSIAVEKVEALRTQLVNLITTKETAIKTTIQELSASTQSIDNKIDSTKTELEGEIEDLQDYVDEKVSTGSTADREYTDTKVASLKSELEQNVNLKYNANLSKINTLESKHDAEVVTLNQTIAANKTDIESKLTSNVATLRGEISASTVESKAYADTKDAQILAEYAQFKQYIQMRVASCKLTITIDEADEAYGTTYGEGNYVVGDTVTIVAENKPNGMFVEWIYGDQHITENPYKLTFTGDTTIQAVFRKRIPFELIDETPEYGYVQYIAHDGTTTESDDELVAYAPQNIEVDINAINYEQGAFVKWSDNSTDQYRKVSLNENMKLSAQFALGCTLTIVNPVKGGGIVKIYGAGEAELESPCHVPSGTQLKVVAVPNYGCGFSNWSDGDEARIKNITLTEDMSLEAYFISE